MIEFKNLHKRFGKLTVLEIATIAFVKCIIRKITIPTTFDQVVSTSHLLSSSLPLKMVSQNTFVIYHSI